MTISQRIFAILHEQNLSQKDLAQYTGISQAAISSWKSKGTNPSSDKIISICEFLNVEPYYLLTGSPDPGTELLQEESTSYGIDNAEMLLLRQFRRLSPLEQGRIIGIIEQMLEQNSGRLETGRSIPSDPEAP